MNLGYLFINPQRLSGPGQKPSDNLAVFKVGMHRPVNIFPQGTAKKDTWSSSTLADGIP